MTRTGHKRTALGTKCICTDDGIIEMQHKIRIAVAGNTLAPALGVLNKLGYTVTRDKTAEQQYQAEDDTCIFVADDPVTLMGLVKIYEERGADWQPSDEEVQLLLLLDECDE
ncbi:hypothetical protein ACL9RI_12265 [Janthinobacterium sp. Mn2066]|uniref:hypothetical protein n=1 Tax=Janthinobacterium sp. Mn2066 TaxID=3395264 RepID=UPI003BDCA38D